MKFHIDGERLAIQASLVRALKDTCTSARVRAAMETGAADPNIWRTLLTEVGVAGLWAPEMVGGAGLGVVEMALAMEAIGYAAAPGPYLAQTLAVRALTLAPDMAPSALLDDVMAGRRKVALCVDADIWLDAPSAGYPEIQALTASYDTVACGADADLFLVARSQTCLVLVESQDAGVQVHPLSASDKTRPVARVSFDNARALLVAEGSSVARLLDTALVLLAADALGGAQRCLDMAVDYAKTREQFGVVIGQFQALKHQLAQMALDVESARALVWYAAHAQDADLPDAARVAALAKAHLADRFTKVARDATEAHGGIGYTWDYDLQIWFRRALFDAAFLGAPALHRERAARMAGW